MKINKKQIWLKHIIRGTKIGIGSCAAVALAEYMGLEYVTSAGTIALLTIATTKWETVWLSVMRVITFAMTVVLCWGIHQYVDSSWAGYGVFVFFLVTISEFLHLRNTVSVNAVVGAHFFSTHGFPLSDIWNEFLLVLIGITIAFILNLFQDNRSSKRKIEQNIHYTEQQLQDILQKLSEFLRGRPIEGNVWEEVVHVEKLLSIFTARAYEYQSNTFQSHPEYYIQYFEMRTKQFNILHNLHYEMKKIRTLPKQAEIVADYLVYLKGYVTEFNDPAEQMTRLQELFADLTRQDLPGTREEFESRAMLYHILMDLEDFLKYKKRFVEALDDRLRRLYWEREK